MNNPCKIAVTTSQPREHLIKIAENISAEIDIKYIPNTNLTIKKLRKLNNVKNMIVVREDRIQITSDENELFFHPGMAIPRIKVLRQGEEDTMAKAMDLNPGNKILDCTLGLANDAIVASFIIGENGLIVGLESSPLIYVITKYGLQNYNRGSKLAQHFMKKIKVIWADYNKYLQTLEDNSFDIVYFDPMFIAPLYKSSGIQNLRNFANYQQLNNSIIQEALRVARKRVIVKNTKESPVFRELNIENFYGGKYSPIGFGVFYKK